PKSYVLRELMPTQDKLDLHGWKGECQLDRLARDLAFLVGWSELRSSGREGSATIDELSDFAKQGRWRKSVVTYAEDYQQTSWQDWKEFRKACRDNALTNR